MPIEDADRVHTRRGGKEEATITILGKKIGIMKLMFIGGGGVAALFILIAAVMMLTAPAPVIIDVNVTPTPTPILTGDTAIGFEIMTTNTTYRVIKMSYIGNKTVLDIQKELMISMYPPESTHYIQRQSIKNEGIKAFNNQYNTIYIYTGNDNTFHMSYILPEYTDCADFIDGEWAIHVDTPNKNIKTFKFTIDKSNTMIVDPGMTIKASLNFATDYTTLFVYSGTYKERLSTSKTVKFIGINNPVIDAGGFGPVITLNSNRNVVSGFHLTNSGNGITADGGIVISPGSNSNMITKNTIYQTIYGVWMSKSSSNIVNNNTMMNNDKIGIALLDSHSNTITGNIIYNNIYGIWLDPISNFNIIRENNVHDNTEYGVYIDNYKNLQNTCEYNIYNNNKMYCSDSVDRTMTPVRTTVKPTVEVTDDWSHCEPGDEKCYQS